MIAKITFSLLLSIIAQTSFAQQIEASCDEQIKHYGEGAGFNSFSQECQDFFIEKKVVHIKKVTDDTEVEVFYYPGILIIDKVEASIKYREFIAGQYSNIPMVSHMAINIGKNEVSLLSNIDSSITTYSTYITGNVSALKVLKHPTLTTAKEIQFDKSEGNLLILNPSAQTLCYFDAKANSNQRKALRKDKHFIVKLIN